MGIAQKNTLAMDLFFWRHPSLEPWEEIGAPLVCLWSNFRPWRAGCHDKLHLAKLMMMGPFQFDLLTPYFAIAQLHPQPLHGPCMAPCRSRLAADFQFSNPQKSALSQLDSNGVQPRCRPFGRPLRRGRGTAGGQGQPRAQCHRLGGPGKAPGNVS